MSRSLNEINNLLDKHTIHITVLYVSIVFLIVVVIVLTKRSFNIIDGFNPNVLPYKTNGFGMNLQSSRPVPYPLEKSMKQPWKSILNPPIDYPTPPKKYVPANLSWNSRNKL